MSFRQFLYHKPVGVVSSRVESDPPPRDGPRPTAYNECESKGFPADVGMVGRLDADTSGVLLFTDNHELNFAIASPNFSQNPHHQKQYVVTVTGSRRDLVVATTEAGCLPSISIAALETELRAPLEFRKQGRDYSTQPPKEIKVLRVWRESYQEYDRSGSKFSAEIKVACV